MLHRDDRTYQDLFGGCEDLQAHQLPWEEFNYATFVVGDMFETYGFFQPQEGSWLYLGSNPRATVDLKRLMGDGDWAAWDDEMGVTPGLTLRLLEEARDRGPAVAV